MERPDDSIVRTEFATARRNATHDKHLMARPALRGPGRERVRPAFRLAAARARQPDFANSTWNLSVVDLSCDSSD